MKLQIKELSKNYGEIQALNMVSMELENGIYGLLGPNGAGKSTLINLLTDNVKRESGDILWDETEILKLGKSYRNILGYMPQEQGYYEDFTAGAFLMYMAKVKGLKKKEAKERTEHLLKIVNLEAIAKEIILLKKGKIIGKGTPENLLQTLDSKVFEVYVDKNDLEKLEKDYIISNLKNSKEGILARVIGEESPLKYKYSEVAASLEDLYLYSFV